MSVNEQQDEQNQSTISTKKSILIRPDNDIDLQDLVNLQKHAGAKFRNSLARLSEKYGFTYNDYKRNRVKITLDFSAFATEVSQQQKQKQKQEKIAKR